MLNKAKMEQEQNQFNVLLANLLSTDNDIRSKAEATCETIPPGNKVIYLLNAFADVNNSEEVRLLSLVLLRRLISSDFDKFYPTLPVEVQNQIKNQLLFSIQNETNTSLRKKMCDCTAELARNLIDEDATNHWPEFLKFLFDCANAPNPMLKESALQIFGLVPGIFGNQQNRYLDLIKQMLFQSLQDQQNQKVRFAALKATVSFLLAHEKETNIQKQFAECLTSMLQVLNESVTQLEDDDVVKCFVDLAETLPRFLRPHLDTVLQICVKVVSERTMPDQWRHLTIEMVVTLSETAPAMMRKLGGKYIAQIVPILFQMMVDLIDDPDWSTQDDAPEEDNDSDPVVGESSLDRLACSLGGKTILPLVVSGLTQMLASEDWRYRHAALMAISAVGEGCHKQMEVILPQIVEGVLKYLQDPHPRVRYAGCNALGQMATDFSPLFEKRFHDRVIPGLCMLLEDNANPRVQAHAGAALVNFFEDCPKNILANYLDSIALQLHNVMTVKIKELVETGKKLMLEQTVVTLSAVADRVEEKFVDYYDRFMPCLKYIIEIATTPELQVLRGKTIECVSLIGLAVGKEKFINDASTVMDMLLKTQTGELEISDDNPQLSYMISAWARICKILGKQFEQYLPFVMGPVLKAASLKPEITVLDSEDMKAINGDDDWQFVTFGEQQNFGIRTVGLEEKATACQMLVCYARELKEGFVAYVEEVVKLMVSMLKFYFHDGVRSAAAECLPFLLGCAKIRGDAYVSDMWQYICPELLKAIEAEPEKEILSELVYSFSQCVTVMESRCLTEEQMNETIRLMDKFLKDHFKRSEERALKRKDEDYDELVEEELVDEDDEDVYLLSKVADMVRALFAAYKQDFLPFFDQILQHFVRLLGPDRPWPDHQWGLCVFDDIIEYGGPACSRYQEYFLQPLLGELGSSSCEVRQAAAYGVGVLAQFAGTGFSHVCQKAVPLLTQMIEAPDSRTPENAYATENAISAVSKIIRYNNTEVNLDELIPKWFSWLPVSEDEDENPHVFGLLCSLLEVNHPALLGKDNCNIPQIVRVMAEAFAREAIKPDSETGTRMIMHLSTIKGNADVFAICLSHLPLELQEVLHKVLS